MSTTDDGTLSSPINTGASNGLPTVLVACFTYEAFVNSTTFNAATFDNSDNNDPYARCHDAAELMCSHGSTGPLCGACEVVLMTG